MSACAWRHVQQGLIMLITDTDTDTDASLQADALFRLSIPFSLPSSPRPVSLDLIVGMLPY